MFRILIIDASSRLKTIAENFWKNTGYLVDVVQASAMQEAIGIVPKCAFWYIDINADTVDYIPQLPVLRANTKTPIFALTSNFNHTEEIASYHGGLDIYTTWEIGFEQQTPESIIAYMSRYKQNSAQDEIKSPRVLVYNGMVLSCDYHCCTVNGTDIPVTKTEFNILYYLLLNRGLVVSP